MGIGFVVSLTGKIAATYHVPFPVIARVSLCVNLLVLILVVQSHCYRTVGCGDASP
jgi:cytosine/uracil/thiamine/allantoin permease